MIIYCNTDTRRAAGGDGVNLGAPFKLNCQTNSDITIKFIDSTGESVQIPAGEYLFTGAAGLYGKNTLFASSATAEADADQLSFTVDTYTEQYIDNVTCPEGTRILIQLHKAEAGGSVLLYDSAIAIPRIHDPSDPPPAELDNKLYFSFSADGGDDWHDEMSEDDQWFKVKWGQGGAYSDKAPIPRGAKGEPGAPGKDGQPGAKGEDGRDGSDGQPGAAAGFGEQKVTVETVDAKEQAAVTITPEADSPDTAKVFNFTFKIPRGEQGIQGLQGVPGEKGEAGAPGAQGEQGKPGEQGAKGDAGPANVLTVSEVVTGEPGTEAQVEITGESPNQSIKFTIPRGQPGEKGEQGQPGEDGSPGPAGEKGLPGENGKDATINNVTTEISTAENGTPTVTVTKTAAESPDNATDLKFVFVIPRGEQGPPGPSGSDFDSSELTKKIEAESTERKAKDTEIEGKITKLEGESVTVSETNGTTPQNTVVTSIVASDHTLTVMKATVKSLGAGEIPENADLDTYKAEGWYTCAADATAATLKNCPTKLAFVLEVLTSGAGAEVYQRLTRREEGGNELKSTICVRSYYKGDESIGDQHGWTKWGVIAVTSEIPTASPSVTYDKTQNKLTFTNPRGTTQLPQDLPAEEGTVLVYEGGKYVALTYAELKAKLDASATE